MTLDLLARRGLALLLDASLKSLLILLVAGLALGLCRRSSAAVRHLVLLLALGGLLALPLLSLTLPPWPVPLWSRTAPPSATTNEAPPIVSAAPPLTEAPALVPAPMPAIIPSFPSVVPPVSPRSPAWPMWLFGAWVGGVLLTLVPTLAGLVAVGRLGRQCWRVTDASLLELTDALRRESRVERSVLVLQDKSGAGGAMPMTWGWQRPAVLLPSGADAWPPERLRAVLLHELAHIRRGDWPIQMLTHAVCALYWFHPGVWLAARQLRIESERACDDLVLAAGVPPEDYARHLLEVIRAMKTMNGPIRVALPMTQAKHMEGRLRSILASGRSRRNVTRRNWTGATLGTIISLGLVAVLRPEASPNLPVSRHIQSTARRPSASAHRRAGSLTTAHAPLSEGAIPRPTRTIHPTVLVTEKGIPIMKPFHTSKHIFAVASTLIPLASGGAHAGPTPDNGGARPIIPATRPSVSANNASSVQPHNTTGVPAPAPAKPAEASPAMTVQVNPADATLGGADVTSHPDPSQRRVSVTVAMSPTAAVLAELFRQVGANYTLDPEVLKTSVTASVSNVSFETALQAILRSANPPLAYVRQNGVYRVRTQAQSSLLPVVTHDSAATPREIQVKFEWVMAAKASDKPDDKSVDALTLVAQEGRPATVSSQHMQNGSGGQETVTVTPRLDSAGMILLDITERSEITVAGQTQVNSTTTRVRIKSGETSVVRGLIRKQEGQQDKHDEERMLFVTPTIVQPSS